MHDFRPEDNLKKSQSKQPGSMESNSNSAHFQSGGEAYALHRPSYPPELAQQLAQACVGNRLAIDVGCGSGQLSLLLADHFERVLATDISADQLAHVHQHPKLTYRLEAAESISAADASADLIVAAQAAHWFDLDRFYVECRRVAAPGAVVALVSYGVPYIEGVLNARFQRFYWQQTPPFWPAGRHQVETGYSELPFPFEQLPFSMLFIQRQWTAGQFLDYLKTWSAYRRACDSGGKIVFDLFEQELLTHWGGPDQPQRICWPISVRLGRL